MRSVKVNYVFDPTKERKQQKKKTKENSERSRSHQPSWRLAESWATCLSASWRAPAGRRHLKRLGGRCKFKSAAGAAAAPAAAALAAAAPPDSRGERLTSVNRAGGTRGDIRIASLCLKRHGDGFLAGPQSEYDWPQTSFVSLLLSAVWDRGVSLGPSAAAGRVTSSGVR